MITPLPTPECFPLWSETPPYWNPEDPRPWPSLRFFPQPERGAPCLVIFPGGGYNICFEPEGMETAEWFYAVGFSVVIVNYRVQWGSVPRPLGRGPLCDAERAMELLGSEAERLGIDRTRVATLGYSAGGHLAGCLALLGAPASGDLVPAATVLCYPWITTADFAHSGCLQNLCGSEPELGEREAFCLERQVRPGLAPIFLWHTAADRVVKVENTLLFAQALATAGVPFGLHIFPRGEHGLRLGTEAFPEVRVWPSLVVTWLQETVWP